MVIRSNCSQPGEFLKRVAVIIVVRETAVCVKSPSSFTG